MSRLDRVLDLLESYDRLSYTALENCYGFKQELLRGLLTDIREKKEKLAKELIEHGCRRRD